MNILTHNQKEIQEVSREYKRIDINTKYCLYHVIEVKKDISHNSSSSINEKIISEKTVQGVCLIENFVSSMNKGVFPHDLWAFIYTPEILNLYAQYGFIYIDPTYNIDYALFNKNGTIEIKEIPSLKLDDYSLDERLNYKKSSESLIFDVILDYPELISDIRLIDFQNHKIKCLDDTYEPLAISFDYMNGKMDNYKYDLNKVSEWIRSRNDVMIMPSGHFSQEINSDNFVRNVPHYNNEEGDRCYIDFTIKPTKEEYMKIVNYLQSKKEHVPIYVAIWEIDVFGLNACAHDPNGTYYTTNED